MYLDAQIAAVGEAMPYRIGGAIAAVGGLTLEAIDLALPVGSLCRIRSLGGKISAAEVIGFRHDRTLLMALGPIGGIARGDPIENISAAPTIGCSLRLLGRVLDGFGNPMDEGGPISFGQLRRIDGRGVPCLRRVNIDKPIATSIRCVDGLATCGLGQRMGIFSGPGVGKSTLLSQIAKFTSADVSVVALIGERGREVQEFLKHNLGAEGLKRCVVVVSTADDPPLLRVRAARVACTIAEYFRDQGKNCLLLIDSLTRLCQAQRQIGLAAHEPPATKGYPPSVFALLPEILERAGKTETGSVTGFYTILVESDDFNEPIADAVKGISDGHIWLSRSLANRGHFPAIDILQSLSRVRSSVCEAEQLRQCRRIVSLMAVYQEIEDLVNIGAYIAGTNIEYDLAIQARPRILQYLQQESTAPTTLPQAMAQLKEVVAWIDQIEKALRAQAAKSGSASGGAAAKAAAK